MDLVRFTGSLIYLRAYLQARLFCCCRAWKTWSRMAARQIKQITSAGFLAVFVVFAPHKKQKPSACPNPWCSERPWRSVGGGR